MDNATRAQKWRLDTHAGQGRDTTEPQDSRTSQALLARPTVKSALPAANDSLFVDDVRGLRLTKTVSPSDR
jgi:hypothetical protein